MAFAHMKRILKLDRLRLRGLSGARDEVLLTATAHTGDGLFANVTSIQRLSTTGGLAPATGCDADHVGAEARVPYTADYFFYRTGNGNGNKQCD